MKRNIEDKQKNIEKKLSKIKLDLENIPNIFEIKDKIKLSACKKLVQVAFKYNLEIFGHCVFKYFWFPPFLFLKDSSETCMRIFDFVP